MGWERSTHQVCDSNSTQGPLQCIPNAKRLCMRLQAGAQGGVVSGVQVGRPASAGTRGVAAAMQALDGQVAGQPFVIVGKDDQTGKK